jgi:hypothetical protein
VRNLSKEDEEQGQPERTGRTGGGALEGAPSENVPALKESGKLKAAIKDAAKRTDEQMKNLMSQGLRYDEAMELVHPENICLPPEDEEPLLGESPEETSE